MKPYTGCMGLIDVDENLMKAATTLGGDEALRDQVVFFLANLLPIALVGAAVWLFATGRTKAARRRNQEVGFAAVLAVLLAVGTRALLAGSLERPRPFAAFPEIHHLTFGPISQINLYGEIYSFPSGHAAVMFAFVGTIFFMGRHNRLATGLFIISVIVITARVVAGFHYPADVIGGAALGLLIGWIIAWQSRVIERNMR